MIVVDDDPSSPLQPIYILTLTLILHDPADSVPDAFSLRPLAFSLLPSICNLNLQVQMFLPAFGRVSVYLVFATCLSSINFSSKQAAVQTTAL